jgi:antitoxin component of MazEF toxin-antitoxin module
LINYKNSKKIYLLEEVKMVRSGFWRIVRGAGGSLYVTLPREIIEVRDIKKGDYVEVEIVNVSPGLFEARERAQESYLKTKNAPHSQEKPVFLNLDIPLSHACTISNISEIFSHLPTANILRSAGIS